MLTLASSARRAGALIERNLAVYRRLPWNIISGFFEPAFYLFSIGIGVGALLEGAFTVNGKPMSYPVFVAPAMMAQAALSGAMIETTFNFFAKMRFSKLYDAFLATPVRPLELALGELAFALIRGGAYSAVFLVMMTAMGLTASWWGLLALPASLLLGMGAGGFGLALATFLRGWQDFDYVAGAMTAMFLFSGTFVPIEVFPVWAQWVIQATPLYHGVELLRSLTTGHVGPLLLVHVGYLAVLAVAGLWLAERRMVRRLLR